MNFLAQNLGTITVGGVVLFIVGALIYNLVKSKRQGKSSCGCACSGCPMSGKCHEAQAENAENANNCY